MRVRILFLQRRGLYPLWGDRRVYFGYGSEGRNGFDLRHVVGTAGVPVAIWRKKPSRILCPRRTHVCCRRCSSCGPRASRADIYIFCETRGVDRRRVKCAGSLIATLPPDVLRVFAGDGPSDCTEITPPPIAVGFCFFPFFCELAYLRRAVAVNVREVQYIHAGNALRLSQATVRGVHSLARLPKSSGVKRIHFLFPAASYAEAAFIV